MKVIGNRKPIEYLLTEEDFSSLDAEYAYLSSKFDMYRPIYTNSKYQASNYAFLEYIYRITTEYTDSKDSFQYIDKSLHFKLNSILNIKQTSHIDALRALENEIDENELKAISSPDMKIVLYSFDKGEFLEEDIIPTESKVRSICYLLTIQSCHYILYTPVMTFIDGYDPYTAEDKIPFIPNSYLEAAKAELIAVKEELSESDEDVEVRTAERSREELASSYETPTPIELSPQPEISDSEEPIEPIIPKYFKKKSKSSKLDQPVIPAKSEISESFHIPESYLDRQEYKNEESFTADNTSLRFTESDYHMIIPSNKEGLISNKNKDQKLNIPALKLRPVETEDFNSKIHRVEAIPDWQATEQKILKSRSGCGDSCMII